MLALINWWIGVGIPQIAHAHARNTLDLPDMYVIQPAHSWWQKENWVHGRPLSDGFRYASDTNPRWLTPEELHELIDAGSPASERLHLAQRARA